MIPTPKSIRSKGLLIVLAPVSVALVCIAVFTFILNEANKEILLQSEAKETLFCASMLEKHLVALGTASAAFAVSHSQEDFDDYLESTAFIKDDLKQMKSLSELLPSGTKHFGQVERCAALMAENAESLRSAATEEGLMRLIFMGKSLKEFINELDHLKTILDMFLEDYRSLDEKQVEHRQQMQSRLSALFWVGGMLDVALACALGIFFSRDISGRIGKIQENTRRFAAGDVLLAKVSGEDEIASLDGVFHGMATAVAESEQNKQRLVAVVSHELKTPLTSLDSTIGLVVAGALGPLSPPAQQRLSKLQTDVTRLKTLIVDLIEIERLDEERTELSKEPYDLSACLQAAVDELQSQANEKRLKLELRSADITVHGDRHRMETAIERIIAAAMENSPPEATVMISAAIEDRQAVVHVFDSGSPANLIERSERLFEQREAAGNRAVPAHLLGLVMARKIVEKQNGSLSSRNRVGTNELCLTLPLS